MAGVYISYPFCRQKCTYCNFASGVGTQGAQASYLRALRLEIEQADWTWTPRTVYLGGGTPSLLAPDEFIDLLALIPGRPWAEATIEVAPGDVEPGQARAWAEAGITRVSLGVQSFDPDVARAAARRHDAEVVQRELEILRGVGITRTSVDLIAGLAKQTDAVWEYDLDWVERLAVEHVSVYMLEVDDESRLGGELRAGGSRYGARETPCEEEVADRYERAVERLGTVGIERYEISNFARPEAESLHNLGYWTMLPYWGFGADAHSYDGGRRWSNVKTAAEYLARFEAGRSPCGESEVLDERRLLEDRLLTGLRTRRGAHASADELAPFSAAVHSLSERGWLESAGHDRIRLTDAGILFANEALGELLF